MKLKVKDVIIPILLFIALFMATEGCSSKGDGDIKTKFTWTIEGSTLIQMNGDEVLNEFDLIQGVTMSVNDTVLGGVILDDPLTPHPVQFNCFDPLTFKMEIKGTDICFSDRTQTLCIPYKDCVSFVLLWVDERICVYITDECADIVGIEDLTSEVSRGLDSLIKLPDSLLNEVELPTVNKDQNEPAEKQ